MIPRYFYKFLLYRITDMFIILLETTINHLNVKGEKKWIRKSLM
jgi:hypothetical protein